MLSGADAHDWKLKAETFPVFDWVLNVPTPKIQVEPRSTRHVIGTNRFFTAT